MLGEKWDSTICVTIHYKVTFSKVHLMAVVHASRHTQRTENNVLGVAHSSWLFLRQGLSYFCFTECENIVLILLSPPPILRLEYWGYRHEPQGMHILKEVYLYFMCVNVLPVCMYVLCVYALWFWNSEKGARYYGALVAIIHYVGPRN